MLDYKNIKMKLILFGSFTAENTMFDKSSNLKAFLKEPVNYPLVNTNSSQVTERVCPASKEGVCTHR